MSWTNSTLVTPISLGIIENQKSYWANHFYSVIQCLDAQKGFKYSPRRIDGYPLWSLSSLRGHLPPNFFDVVQDYLRNWGFQYFLVSFLNQKMSSNLVQEVVNRLGALYNISFSDQLREYSFHISGNDSALSDGLKSHFSEVFPLAIGNNKPDIDKVIANSDICLVLKNPDTDTKVGIFGEVEGVYGNKLRNQSFWDGKSDFCVFNIGMIDGKTKQCYIENVTFNGSSKVNLYFEKEHFVANDFSITLEWFKQLLMYGPHFSLKANNEEFDYFINYLKVNWAKPACELLEHISSFLDGNDLVGRSTTELPIITDPTS
ncbi:hypothetical protein AAFX30_09775 [Vibrio chagasii]|uniref:hypothetical protein n=1 Tax=Vibrio chagasii TaxID=170679 RepID=UPI0038CDB223